MFLYWLEIAVSLLHHQANFDCFTNDSLGTTPLFNVTAETDPLALFDIDYVRTELRLMDCYRSSSRCFFL